MGTKTKITRRCKFCQKRLKPSKTTNGHRGRPREFCDEVCRRRFHRLKPCERCGKPSWDGHLCSLCGADDYQMDRVQGMATLWNSILDLRVEGLLNYQIAGRLRRKELTIVSSITRMRNAGLAVPESTYDRAGWMDKWIDLQTARKAYRRQSMHFDN